MIGGVMSAYNRLHPWDDNPMWISSPEYTEEEYQEWITKNLEQYYKEIGDGEIEETRE